MTTLHIRGMVCYRCEVVIRELMQHHGLEVTDVRLGQVTVKEVLDVETLNKVTQEMKKLRLEVIHSPDEILVKDIKLAVQQMVENGTEGMNNSQYLVEQIGRSYASLSKSFVQEEGISIQQYIKGKRMDKVKELISYGELTLSEIADRLGYSSVQYLSQQFKKQVGTTPSIFKTELPKLDRES